MITRLRTYHAQPPPLVLVHDISQDLARRSDRDPLLVTELVHTTLHAEVGLPVSVGERGRRVRWEQSGRDERDAMQKEQRGEDQPR